MFDAPPSPASSHRAKPQRSIGAALLQTLSQELLSSGLLGTATRAVVTTAAATQAKSTALDAVGRLAFVAAACLLAVAGAGFLLAASYFFLEPRMGAVGALASLGGFLWLIVIALLMYGQRPKAEPAAEPVADIALGKLTEIYAEARKIAQAHPFLMVAAAFGVGLILAQPSSSAAEGCDE